MSSPLRRKQKKMRPPTLSPLEKAQLILAFPNEKHPFPIPDWKAPARRRLEAPRAPRPAQGVAPLVDPGRGRPRARRSAR